MVITIQDSPYLVSTLPYRPKHITDLTVNRFSFASKEAAVARGVGGVTWVKNNIHIK